MVTTSEKFRVWLAKAEGAEGDGITDDTAAIQSAIDAVHAAGGGIVYLSAGTYKVTDTIDLYPDVKMEGTGVVLDAQTITANVLSCVGTPVNLPAQVGDHVVANRTWEFNAAHGLVVGDVIRVENTANSSLNAYRTYYRKRECFTVREVPSTTTIETTSGAILEWAATESTWRKLPGDALEILGDITIIGNAASSSNTYCLVLQDVAHARIRGVKTRNAYDSGIGLLSCYGVVIESSALLKDVDDVHGGSYGIVIGGCQDVRVSNSIIFGKRHAVAVGGTGCNIHIFIDGCTLDSDDSYSADFHGNVLHSAYRNCVLGNGMSLGGNHNEITGCEIRGDGIVTSELWGYSHRIVSNTVTQLNTSKYPVYSVPGANCTEGGVFVVDSLTCHVACPSGICRILGGSAGSAPLGTMRVVINNIHQLDCTQSSGTDIQVRWLDTATQTTSAVISNCRVAGSINVAGGQEVSVDNVIVVDSTVVGITIDKATNASVRNCDLTVTTHGMNITNVSDTLIVRQCTLRHTGVAAYGMIISGASGAPIDYVRISDVVMIRSHYIGVKLDHATLCDIDGLRVLTESSEYLVWATANVATLVLSEYHCTAYSKMILYAVKKYINITGTATPESAMLGSVGSSVRDINGGANTTLYVKEAGDGNTGWAAM